MNSGGLPYPATFTNALSKPRSRWKALVVLAGCSTAALFYFTSDAGMPFEARQPLPALSPGVDLSKAPTGEVAWRPDMAFGVKEGRPVQVDQPEGGRRPWQRPSRPLGHDSAPNGEEEEEELSSDIPIRVDPSLAPAYKYGWDTFPPSDSDPWPDRPEIAADFFRLDRKTADPPIPDWPEHSTLTEAMLTYPFPLITHDDMVAFEDLPKVTPKNEHKSDRIDGMGEPGHMPRVQVGDYGEGDQEKEERQRRRNWVERAIKHGWENYKQFAWGSDEIMPISQGSKNPFSGWGATLVDILDLLLLLGWDHEYALARTHVKAIDFTIAFHDSWQEGLYERRTIPTFETCIRYLGGFLSAYDLSGDEMLLERAKELADWLTGAFSSKYGLPAGHYDFGVNLNGRPAGNVVLAEAGTMGLEFIHLSQITGERKYFDIAQRVTDFFDTHFENVEHPQGLFPMHVPDDDDDMVELHGTYTMGGMADSYYEYLIKIHQLLGGALPQYARMYTEAMDSTAEVLVQEVSTIPGQTLLTIGELAWGTANPTYEHLTCFAGAMMGLGAKLLDRHEDMSIAQNFTETCVWAYNMTHSGVAPESLQFWKDTERGRYARRKDKAGKPYAVPRGSYTSGIKRMNTEYKGRPETIESVFYMWRITGDKKWQDKGWSMFHSFVEAAAVEGGFAAVANVASSSRRQLDFCESFVFAETLKYYWLLFSDNDVLSLDDWVFSTEAHPFRLPHNQRSKIAKPFEEDVEIEQKYQDPHDRAAGSRPIGHGTALQHRVRVSQGRKAAADAKMVAEQRAKALQAQIDGDDEEKPEKGAPRRIPVGMGGGGHRQHQ